MIRAQCVPKDVVGAMRRALTELALALPALLGVACGGARHATSIELANANDTGSTVKAETEVEREILKALPSLPSGVSRPVRGTAVIAQPAYTAASGRTCRALELGPAGRRPSSRLACSDGGAWFFVPGVFWESDRAE